MFPFDPNINETIVDNSIEYSYTTIAEYFLQKEKQTVKESLVALKEKQDLLDKLVRGYESMQKDYEFRRKRFKLEQKQQELQDTGLVNKEVERLIKEIKEEKNIEKARELAIRLREERAKKVLEVEAALLN